MAVATNAIVSSLVFFVLFSPRLSSAQSGSSEVVPIAAEFDRQSSVWIIWPPVDHVQGQSNERVVTEIVNAIAPTVPVQITAANEELLEQAKRKIRELSLPEKASVQFHIVPTIEFWTRDMGPNFVQSRNGKKQIVDFRFDAWGYASQDDPDTKIEEAYDRNVAKRLDLTTVKSTLVSEGGNRESNGRGTLMLSETVELARNPDKSKQEIEAEFRRVLGVTNVIWLGPGLREDDHTFLGPIGTHKGLPAYTAVTTNGHVDEFARFVAPDTVLLAEVPEDDLDTPIGKENQRRLEISLRILEQARDQDGKRFRILRAPLPPPIYKIVRPGDSVYDYIATLDYQDGSKFPQGEPVAIVAAASYLNFLITNSVVVAPKYGTTMPRITSRDNRFRSLLVELFPQREIVMIDPLPVNFGGGGIHCITMQEPALKTR